MRFRKQHEEQLDYTVEPTEQGLQELVEAATARIEVIDDRECIRYGEDQVHRLAPDNEDIWNDQVYYTRRGDEVLESRSTMTNRFVRNFNLEMIAMGGRPLFITWDEVDTSRVDLGAPRLFKWFYTWREKRDRELATY